MSFNRIYLKDIRGKKISLIDYSSIDSRQTNTTTDEKPKLIKMKTVTFNGVEIIDVESYKEYNQMNVLQLESLEKNSNICKECNCTII